jgi:hypothetical protein
MIVQARFKEAKFPKKCFLKKCFTSSKRSRCVLLSSSFDKQLQSVFYKPLEVYDVTLQRVVKKNLFTPRKCCYKFNVEEVIGELKPNCYTLAVYLFILDLKFLN